MSETIEYTETQATEEAEMTTTATIKPRQMKLGMEIKVDGEWMTIEELVMLPGGGTRTIGARRGQYVIRGGGREIAASGRDEFEARVETNYPEPRSIAHNANARTGVYLGELRDV